MHRQDDPLLAQRLRRGIRRARQQATQAPGLADQTGYVDALMPDYEVLAPIRHGGQAAVFRALHAPTGRTVALKILLSERSDLRQRVRFEREVAVVSRLQHVHIVPLYDCGEAGGHLYYTMPIVEGLSLDGYALVNDLSVVEMTTLFERVCRAVHFAHQNGVIHRDLHPDNILVAEDGEPRVLDFGLAGDGGWNETPGGPPMGVLPYMSPEHLGRGDGLVDVRSDVYSLGVLLFMMLAERLPYRRGSRGDALRASILEGDVLPLRTAFRQSDPARRAAPRDCNADLEAILAKAIAVEKDDRYQSALNLANDLAAFRRGETVSARPLSRASVRGFVRKHRWATAGAAGILLGLLTTAVVYLGIERQRNRDLLRYGESIGEVAVSLTDLNAENARSLIGGDELADALEQRLDALSPVFDDILEASIPDRIRLKFIATSVRAAGEPEWPLGDDVRRITVSDHHCQSRMWSNYRDLVERVGVAEGWTAPLRAEFLRASGVVAAMRNEPALIEAALEMVRTETSSDPQLAEQQAQGQIRLGILQERRNRSPDAIRAYDAAVRALPHPTTAVGRALQLEARMRAAAVRRWTNDVQAGRDQTLQAMADARQAVADHPADRRLRALLAQLRNHAAGVYRATRRQAEALDVLELNLRDLRQLQEFGLTETYQLRCTVGQLVPIYLQRGQREAALECALPLLEELRRLYADTEGDLAAADLADGLNTAGRAVSPYALTGRPEDLEASDPRGAIALHREAFDLVQAYMPEGTFVGQFGNAGLHALRMQAANQRMLGDDVAAAALLERGLRAIGPQPEAVRTVPAEELLIWLMLGEIRLEQGACEAAAEALGEAERIVAQFARQDWVLPFQAGTRRDLADLREGLSGCSGG